jgi:hypothetical protein
MNKLGLLTVIRSLLSLSMECLRKFVSLALVLAFAGYSVVISAVVHSHEASGPHQIHFLDNHDSLHNKAESNSQQGSGADNQNSQDRSEPGFHSHISPHFSEADKVNLIYVLVAASLEKWGEPSGLSSPTKDGPPFKPPRTIL